VRRNFAKMFSIAITRMIGLSCVEENMMIIMLSRFDTIPQREIRTNDRILISYISIACQHLLFLLSC